MRCMLQLEQKAKILKRPATICHYENGRGYQESLDHEINFISAKYFSKQFFVVVAAPPAPNNVRVSRSTDGRSMNVSWDPLTIVDAGSFVTFRVTFTAPNSRRKRQSVTTCALSDSSPCDVDGSQTSVLITGLDSGTNYYVGVTTVNGLGMEGMISPITISPGEPH